MTDIASSSTTQHWCLVCGSTIQRRSRGRRRRFCSRACQQEAFRSRVSRDETAAEGVIADSPRNASFVTRSVSKNSGLQSLKIDLQKAGLSWIKVNDVTWKLTDGKMSRTPASHGQWGGYETERALAWVIEVGWPFGQSAWHARCGDRSYGPTDFNIAKQAAAALASGRSFPKHGCAKLFNGPVDLNVPPTASENIQVCATPEARRAA
jgi:hypothetical protein